MFIQYKRCLSLPGVVSAMLAIASVSLTGCSKSPVNEAVTTEPVLAVDSQQSTSYLQRDVVDDVFYFVLPDRFNNGDPANDQGSATVAISRGGFDKTKSNYYHGGDMRGLQEKLPYLKEMGITAIWMTPILRNQAVQGQSTGYHGYWVLDFTEIDPHLGSNEDLKSLIDAAHDMEIKVFFDIITNHTADVIKFTDCHGDDGLGWLVDGERCPYKSLAQVAGGDNYQTVIPEGAEQVKVPAWLNETKYYHNQGDSTFSGENSLYGDFVGLDDLDTDNPQVVSGMVDIFTKIIDEFRPDGFRIDTVKHVNIEFWQSFSPALMAHAQSIGIPNFFMFGEVYDGDPAVLSQFTTTGKLPSVLDFGFQSAVYQSLVKEQGTSVFKTLFDQDDLYKDADSSADRLLNFVGNHDMGRFGHFLSHSSREMDDEERLKRTKLAHALMFFARGIPVIYYGAEQGFTGDGGDNAARADMMPSLVASYNDDDLIGTNSTTAKDNFDQHHPLYQAFKEYADIYQAHPALRQGVHQHRYAQDTPGIYAFSRVSQDDPGEYLVVVNTATTAQSVSLTALGKQYTSIYGADSLETDNRSNITVTAAPLSVAIYQQVKQ